MNKFYTIINNKTNTLASTGLTSFMVSYLLIDKNLNTEDNTIVQTDSFACLADLINYCNDNGIACPDYLHFEDSYYIVVDSSKFSLID